MTSEAFAAWQSLVFGAAHDPPRALRILQEPPPGLTSGEWARGQFWKAWGSGQVPRPGVKA